MDLSERVERWEVDEPNPLKAWHEDDTVALLRDLIEDWRRLRAYYRDHEQDWACLQKVHDANEIPPDWNS